MPARPRRGWPSSASRPGACCPSEARVALCGPPRRPRTPCTKLPARPDIGGGVGRSSGRMGSRLRANRTPARLHSRTAPFPAPGARMGGPAGARGP
eukprot:439811-Alexandrium_andersonii.AAC.1